MRVLCSCPPMEGLLHPLLPLAGALTAAGHEVRLATGPDRHDRIRAAGLVPAAAGPSEAEGVAATMRLPEGVTPASDPSRFGALMFTRVIAPAKLPDLERLIATWHPDLLISVWVDAAAPIAAAAAGLPIVMQGLGLVPPSAQLRGFAQGVAPLWQERGLAPDPTLGLARAVYLHPAPPRLQPEAEEWLPTLRPMRLTPTAQDEAALPAALERLGARPAVYVSLGTVPAFNRPAFFTAILAGLADLDVTVVATVGENNDPAAFGPQPPHVRLARWLPLASLLARCAVVVSHGGSGTMLATLAAGLPMLLLPRGADQFENATACRQAGVAAVLRPEEVSPETVAVAVHRLLTDAVYHDAAQALRAEIATLPDPASVVPLLERTARGDALPPPASRVVSA